MQRVSSRFLILVVSLTVACGEALPTDPPPASSVDLVTETANSSAVVQMGESFFIVDFVDYFPCVDEVVHLTTYAPFEYHLVQTSSGNVIYHDRIISEEITGTITGLTSGRVWERAANVSPLQERSTGGDSGMFHYTFKGLWVSDNAQDLIVNEIVHFSWNAHGEVTAEQSRFNCRVAGYDK